MMQDPIQLTQFSPFTERHRRAEAGLCAECGRRRGYQTWGDSLAMTHGGGELRCGVCVYGPQLRHALARAIRIPVLVGKFLWALTTERRCPATHDSGEDSR